jgi:hypothetical protein
MSPHSARDRRWGPCLLGDGGCCCGVLAIGLCKLRITRNLGSLLQNLGARRVTWQFDIDDPGFLSDLSSGTYECSIRPTVYWVPVNVPSVHYFLGTYKCSKLPPVYWVPINVQVSTISWVHKNVGNYQQFLGYLSMFQVSTISWVHTIVRNFQQFLGYLSMFQVPTISWVHTNVGNYQQFLGYLSMFQVSTISLVHTNVRLLGTYQCSKCPLLLGHIRMLKFIVSTISWVRTNVKVYWVPINVPSVHCFLGTYEC